MVCSSDMAFLLASALYIIIATIYTCIIHTIITFQYQPLAFKWMLYGIVMNVDQGDVVADDVWHHCRPEILHKRPLDK